MYVYRIYVSMCIYIYTYSIHTHTISCNELLDISDHNLHDINRTKSASNLRWSSLFHSDIWSRDVATMESHALAL